MRKIYIILFYFKDEKTSAYKDQGNKPRIHSLIAGVLDPYTNLHYYVLSWFREKAKVINYCCY